HSVGQIAIAVQWIAMLRKAPVGHDSQQSPRPKHPHTLRYPQPRMRHMLHCGARDNHVEHSILERETVWVIAHDIYVRTLSHVKPGILPSPPLDKRLVTPIDVKRSNV